MLKRFDVERPNSTCGERACFSGFRPTPILRGGSAVWNKLTLQPRPNLGEKQREKQQPKQMIENISRSTTPRALAKIVADTNANVRSVCGSQPSCSCQLFAVLSQKCVIFGKRLVIPYKKVDVRPKAGMERQLEILQVPDRLVSVLTTLSNIERPDSTAQFPAWISHTRWHRLNNSDQFRHGNPRGKGSVCRNVLIPRARPRNAHSLWVLLLMLTPFHVKQPTSPW